MFPGLAIEDQNVFEVLLVMEDAGGFIQVVLHHFSGFLFEFDFLNLSIFDHEFFHQLDVSPFIPKHAHFYARFADVPSEAISEGCSLNWHSYQAHELQVPFILLRKLIDFCFGCCQGWFETDVFGLVQLLLLIIEFPLTVNDDFRFIPKGGQLRINDLLGFLAEFQSLHDVFWPPLAIQSGYIVCWDHYTKELSFNVEAVDAHPIKLGLLLFVFYFAEELVHLLLLGSNEEAEFLLVEGFVRYFGDIPSHLAH